MAANEAWKLWRARGQKAIGKNDTSNLVHVQSVKPGRKTAVDDSEYSDSDEIEFQGEDEVWQWHTPRERDFAPVDQEVWRWLPDIPCVQVSNKCRVRRWTEDGYRLLRISKNPVTGYLCINLYRSNGVRTTELLHRLVCKAFHGMPKPGQIARHLKDPNVERCEPENVGWGTYLDNARDRALHTQQGLPTSRGRARKKDFAA